MVDVFISYKRRLRSKVEVLAESLRALELEVWYDAGLKPGMSFGQDIANNVRTAKAVVVCWTPDAFHSGGDKNGWVQGEATIGRDRSALASIMFEPCLLDPPFNMDHVEDFIEWNGEYNAPFRNLIERIGGLCDRPGLARYPGGQAPLDERVAWAEKFPEDRLALGILDAKKKRDAEAERLAILAAWELERSRQAQLNHDFEQRLASLGLGSAPPAPVSSATVSGAQSSSAQSPSASAPRVEAVAKGNDPPVATPAPFSTPLPAPRKARMAQAAFGLGLVILGAVTGWGVASLLASDTVPPAARARIQTLETAKNTAEKALSTAKAAQASAEADKNAAEKIVAELRASVQKANADKAVAERLLAAQRPVVPPPATAPVAPPPVASRAFKVSEAKFFEEKERADLVDYDGKIKTWSLAVEDPTKPSQWSLVGWDNVTDEERDTIALQRCQYVTRKPCTLYARNGLVVMPSDGRPAARSVLIERGRFDENNIPFIRPTRAKELGETYRALASPRAFAIHRDGTTSVRSGASSELAQQEALKACNDLAKNRFGDACVLYALDNEVVLHRRATSAIN
jgi:flagellum-specific peptidoglycan hydrolase FlgJ